MRSWKPNRPASGDPDAPPCGRVAAPPGPMFLVLFLLVALLLATAVTSGVLLRAAHRESRHVAEIERLREENQAQRFHIQKLADRFAHMDRRMEKLQDFQAKLKILADMDLHQGADASMATGGPQVDEPELNAYLEKNLKRQIERVHWELEELSMQARIQEQDAYRIASFFESQRSLLAATPAIWPVRGWITSTFGRRVSPFTGEIQMHRGLDIGSREGTPIKASADGTVVFSGWKQEYGKTLVLDHGYGYKTRYGHLSKLYVRKGQRVKRGAIVGAVGNTGRSTGPHLHYEVRVHNVPVDPRTYLLD